VFDVEECSDKGGEERGGGGVFHKNAMGGLGSFSLWMWWETIVEGAKDSAATGKRIRRDNMRSSTAVRSNPWERWKGREVEQHDSGEQSDGEVIFSHMNPSPIINSKWMLNGRAEVEK
jgi:hypothetical protein